MSDQTKGPKPPSYDQLDIDPREVAEIANVLVQAGAQHVFPLGVPQKSSAETQRKRLLLTLALQVVLEADLGTWGAAQRTQIAAFYRQLRARLKVGSSLIVPGRPS